MQRWILAAGGRVRLPASLDSLPFLPLRSAQLQRLPGRPESPLTV